MLRMDNASYEEAVGVNVATAIGDAGESVRGTALAAGIAYTTLDRKIKNGQFTVLELRRIGKFLGRETASFLPAEVATITARAEQAEKKPAA